MNDTKTRPSEQLVRNAQMTLAGLLRARLYDFDNAERVYPESMPMEAHRYGCSGEFIRDAQRFGHFFDEATMRSFRTKTYELIGERFLIISDKSDWGPRQYRVAWVYQNKATCNNADHIRKSVETTDLSKSFASLTQARKFAHNVAELIDLIQSA